MSSALWCNASDLLVVEGDVLRVRHDAYKTSAGRIHNGRLVRVVDIVNGDVIVSSIDMKLPYIAAARHAAYRLEKKIAEI